MHAVKCFAVKKLLLNVQAMSCKDKKLSYRRETARQLPTWRGLGPPAHSPPPPLATPMHGRIRNAQRTYVRHAVH